MGKKPVDVEVSAGGIVFRQETGRPPVFLLIKDSYRNWGFPKGHLEEGETPAQAAQRETAEETGLANVVMHGPIRLIDWHFKFRGRRIHKYCHFFLFESPEGDPAPQEDEGITACRWCTPRPPSSCAPASTTTASAASTKAARTSTATAPISAPTATT